MNGNSEDNNSKNLKNSSDHENNHTNGELDDDDILEGELKDIDSLVNANECTTDIPNGDITNGHANSTDTEDGVNGRANGHDHPEIKHLPIDDQEDLKNALRLTMPELTVEEELELLRKPKRFMDDGEEIRDPKPGFQDLGNCKRFWKAQQMIGTRKIK